MSEEIRTVDPKTGGEKGSKLARFDLLPWDAIWALAEHFGRGARKYADRNWEKGYGWGLSFAALHRHLAAWWGGEDIDEETGSHHLLAVAWHALAMWWFQRHGKGTDDRPRG
ncbi:MAG TPA: dATP/dGTP diphosphohydrolase domain-containing protein [bacterium]|nr:dATP/dGTP diphosphohydrolase domain-containing protein [bacterium]